MGTDPFNDERNDELYDAWIDRLALDDPGSEDPNWHVRRYEPSCETAVADGG